MKKSEIYTHSAPRFLDAKLMKENPEKVASDINKTFKDLWRRNIDHENRIRMLEEAIEQMKNIRPPLRYPL